MKHLFQLKDPGMLEEKLYFILQIVTLDLRWLTCASYICSIIYVYIYMMCIYTQINIYLCYTHIFFFSDYQAIFSYNPQA